MAPSTVTGGGHSELIVHLSGNASSPVSVALLTSDPSANVPSSITVNAGQDVATMVFSTNSVDAPTVATISGSLNGISQSGTLTVNPPVFSSLACSTTAAYGGANVSLYIYLSGAAGPSGVPVTLTSSYTSAASVPSGATIPPGQAYLTVPITTYPVDFPASVTITATIGSTSNSVTLTVNSPFVSSIFSSPASVHAGGSTRIWVDLNTPAGPSGVNVTISTDTPSLLNLGASSLFIPANSRTGFITANAPGGVDNSTTVGVMATLGSSTANGAVTIVPASVSSAMASPSSVNAGSSCTLYVYLNGPAGPSGISVALASLNPAAASVPGTLTIAPNAANGKVAVTTFGVDSLTGMGLQASGNGGVATASLTVNPNDGLKAVNPGPTYRIGGQTGSTLYIYLTGPAGPSGVTVNIWSNNPALATVPTTATVASGKTYGYATITTTSVGMNVPITFGGEIGGGPVVTGIPLLLESQIGSPWAQARGNVYGTGQAVGSGATGQQAWLASVPASPYVYDPVIGPNGNLYFTNDSNVYSYYPNGTLQWSVSVNDPQGSVAIGADGTIYVQDADDGSLLALNPDGSTKWTVSNAVNGGSGNPVIGVDGTIYTVGWDPNTEYGAVYAVNPDSTIKWICDFSNDFDWPIIGGCVLGPDGSVYVPIQGWFSGSGIFAVDSTGTQEWYYEDDSLWSSLAVAPDGTLYFGDEDGTVYALNPDASVKWTYQTTGDYFSDGNPSIASNGTVYIGSGTGNLYAFSPNGTLQWTYVAATYLSGQAAIGGDGTIYFMDGNGMVWALNPNGSAKWSFATAGANDEGYGSGTFNDPIIGQDGTVYVSSTGGIYAIH